MNGELSLTSSLPCLPVHSPSRLTTQPQSKSETGSNQRCNSQAQLGVLTRRAEVWDFPGVCSLPDTCIWPSQPGSRLMPPSHLKLQIKASPGLDLRLAEARPFSILTPFLLRIYSLISLPISDSSISLCRAPQILSSTHLDAPTSADPPTPSGPPTCSIPPTCSAPPTHSALLPT